MSKFQLITRREFGDKRWKPFVAYQHVAGLHFAGVSAAELPQVTLAFPIVFMEHQTVCVPVALFGFKEGRNLFVGPKGEWLGGYIPAQVRKMPFRLLQDDTGRLHLGIDMESGAVVSAAEAGEPFFAENDQPSPKLKAFFDFMLAVHQAEQATQKAVQCLKEYGLLKPLSIKGILGEMASTQGVFHVDEAKLKRLDGEALKTLQTSGALTLAYYQHLSEQHLPALARRLSALAEKQERPPAPQTVPATADLMAALSQHGTLNLSGLS